MRKYKLGKGIKKALLAALAVAAGLIGGAEVLGGVHGLDRVTAVSGAAALVAGIRIALNYWKQGRKAKRAKLKR